MCYYHITYYYICWYQWLKLSFGFKPMAFWLIYCVVYVECLHTWWWSSGAHPHKEIILLGTHVLCVVVM